LRWWSIKGDEKQLIKLAWPYVYDSKFKVMRSLDQGQIKENGQVLLEEKFAVK